MKFSEKDIQEYIWKHRENWSDLIEEINFPELYSFEGEDGPEKITAEKLVHNITITRLISIYEDVKYLDLFGCEVPLGKKGRGRIRADFLASHEGTPGIFIIELKKADYSEREAFTELMAYAYSLNAIFPSSCTDDVKYVLIAPAETKTLKAAFLQALIFENKRVCLLQPYFGDPNDINTLSLQPFIPTATDISLFSNRAFKKRNFDVEVTCWTEITGYWNSGKSNPGQYQKERMVDLTTYAAQMMEAKKIHGFVYAQQSWPEIQMPYPNKLVFVVLNPYKIASDNYIKQHLPDMPDHKIPDIYSVQDTVNLSDILDGLKKNHAELHEDWNYFASYAHLWGSHMMSLGQQVLEEVNINKKGEQIDIDTASGGTFDYYEVSQIENIFTSNFPVRPTGIVRELYSEMTRLDYIHWNKFDFHPHYGDSFGWARENLESHMLFTTFLSRLFNSSFDEPDEDDEDDDPMQDE